VGGWWLNLRGCHVATWVMMPPANKLCDICGLAGNWQLANLARSRGNGGSQTGGQH